jgi:UDP-N-acetylmuramate dehydrogenase
MDLGELYIRFLNLYKGPVIKDEPLSSYTSFRTGGKADLFAEVVDAQQMAAIIMSARSSGVPYFVIGEGSNLLVSDKGFRGLIIRNRIKGLTVRNNDIVAGAGELLNDLVDFATECSLTGCEFAAGIWGTVGGAVYGNAGAFGSQISAIFKYAELVTPEGTVRQESSEYFAFEYRHSRLKDSKEIVTQACFGLTSGDGNSIAQRVAEIRTSRSQKHPTEACSAGCFFKNIEDPGQPNGKLAAGKLLEEVGAKEMRIGGAAVYDRHANIIINSGGAKSKDIRKLADILKERVRRKFNLVLQEEVICLGDFD